MVIMHRKEHDITTGPFYLGKSIGHECGGKDRSNDNRQGVAKNRVDRHGIKIKTGPAIHEIIEMGRDRDPDRGQRVHLGVALQGR